MFHCKQNLLQDCRGDFQCYIGLYCSDKCESYRIPRHHLYCVAQFACSFSPTPNFSYIQRSSSEFQTRRLNWMDAADFMHNPKTRNGRAILLACSCSVWFIVIQDAKRNPSFTRLDVLWFFISCPGCVMFSYWHKGGFISCREWWGSFRGFLHKSELFVFFLLSGVQIAYLAIIGTQLFMILLSIVLLIGIHKVSFHYTYVVTGII